MAIGYIEAVNATSSEKKIFEIKALIKRARPQLPNDQIERLAKEYLKENKPVNPFNIDNFLGLEGV